MEQDGKKLPTGKKRTISRPAEKGLDASKAVDYIHNWTGGLGARCHIPHNGHIGTIDSL
jgi:hypothetical protein